MSHEPKPSEHAMRAAENIYRTFFNSREVLAHIIDQHAIAPAVAERDRRIVELEELIHNGWYVFKHLSEAEQKYTSADNVSAVLNAFKRAAFPRSERSTP